VSAQSRLTALLPRRATALKLSLWDGWLLLSDSRNAQIKFPLFRDARIPLGIPEPLACYRDLATVATDPCSARLGGWTTFLLVIATRLRPSCLQIEGRQAEISEGRANLRN
jgi:hypothetical protein